jgi:hypothetical protein
MAEDKGVSEWEEVRGEQVGGGEGVSKWAEGICCGMVLDERVVSKER